jgi:CubicO group peptidase (beta-lactamase class C family)
MPDYRKPSIRSSRPEATPPTPADSGGFSIESTTMRLKSMRLRRAENEKQEAERVASDRPDSVELPRGAGPAGRVRHDERGVAVWDWAVASGEFQTLSATRALKKLEVADLKIEDTQRNAPALTLEKAGRDKGGGFDPYNQRGSGKRVGEAAERQGVTGAKDKAAVLDQLLGNKK